MAARSIGPYALCSHANALALSPLLKTLNSGWAKCAAILGAIVRIVLSVTAATRSILRWWSRTNLMCSISAPKLSYPGKEGASRSSPIAFITRQPRVRFRSEARAQLGRTEHLPQQREPVRIGLKRSRIETRHRCRPFAFGAPTAGCARAGRVPFTRATLAGMRAAVLCRRREPLGVDRDQDRGRVLQRGGSLSKLSGTAIVTSSLGDLTQYLGSSPSTGSKPVTSYSPIQAGRPIGRAQTVTASPSANLWVAIPCSLGTPCCAPHEPPSFACSCRDRLRSAVALLFRSARGPRARVVPNDCKLTLARHPAVRATEPSRGRFSA